MLSSYVSAASMLGAVGLLAACHSDRIRLTPAQQQIQQQLQGLDPHQHPLPRATPLIDVHTHTFNARYLPLRGILLGKRDVSLATLLLSDACAATLAEALPAGPVALVLGAEGEGMRHNIVQHCDTIARLPIASAIESLNVSNAAAISLYAIATRD